MGSSWKYHNKNVPIEEYTTAGNAAWKRLFRSPGDLSPQVVYLASDDPGAFKDLQSQLEPGSRIFSLTKSRYPDFRSIASPAPYFQDKFSALPKADRVRLTMGMIVDFAVLSGMWARDDEPRPGAVICGLRYARFSWSSCLRRGILSHRFPSQFQRVQDGCCRVRLGSGVWIRI